MQVWTCKYAMEYSGQAKQSTKHKPIGNLAKTGKPYAVKVARTVWKQGKTREGSTYAYGDELTSEAS